MRDDDERLVEAILAASRALVAAAAVSLEAAPVEVTLIQYRALVVIATHGPQPMAKLASALRQRPSSTTRMVERLERKGLVERRPSPASRRSVELHLTPPGAALVAAVMDDRRRELRGILERVPPSRHAEMRRAFERFAVAAGEPLDGLET